MHIIRPQPNFRNRLINHQIFVEIKKTILNFILRLQFKFRD